MIPRRVNSHYIAVIAVMLLANTYNRLSFFKPGFEERAVNWSSVVIAIYITIVIAIYITIFVSFFVPLMLIRSVE